ncbi:MAG: hydroxyacylglutathione hydrolase [Persicimonas sp.]
MDVHIIASEVSDNYFYLLTDQTGAAALIDPVDGKKAVEVVRDHGLELAAVINTHFHHDHIGGNDAVFEAFDEARLVAAAGDADRIASQQSHPIDEPVGDGDRVEFGETALQVMETPGHTPGHVSLAFDDHLFCGDTIFVAGAGNCNFGGDPGVLFATFRDVLSELPDQMVFYPGHDYSVRDLEFVLSVEPDNEIADELLAEARASNEEGELFLTTLGRERQYSPFFRYDDPALADRLAAEHPQVLSEESSRSESKEEAVFRTVRELRNRW